MTGLFYAVAYVVMFCQLLPLAALWYHPSQDRNRRRVALLGILWFAEDILSRFVLYHGFTTNTWLHFGFRPLVTLLILRILYDWQRSERTRRGLRVIAPLYLLAFIALAVLVERENTLGLVTGPLTGVVVLVAVLFTLIHRSQVEPDEFSRSDWFWVCTGLSLQYALDTFIQPALQYMIGTSLDGSIGVAVVNILVSLVAILFIARGMLCPAPDSARQPLPPAALSVDR